MTAVNDIIEKGDAIADDVTAFSAAEGERAMRATNATESGGPWLSAACTFQCIGHFAHEFAFPLTVTAVREQPAEPAPDVLDLVRQYAQKRVAAAVLRLDDADEAAELRAEEHADLWSQLVAAVNALSRGPNARNEAEPDAPLVLSLPTVPDGAVALIGGKTGWTYRLWSTPEWGLWHSDDPEGGTEPGKLGALLDGEGSVSVVMREPRTWPKLDAPDASAVRGASGRIWRRVSPTVWACRDNEGGEECENFAALQQYDGPLVEVFDDKDSTR